jgi:hypothetical protein
LGEAKQISKLFVQDGFLSFGGAPYDEITGLSFRQYAGLLVVC